MSEDKSASIRIVVQFLDRYQPVKLVEIGTIGPYDPMDVTEDQIIESIIGGLRAGAEELAKNHYADKALSDPQPEGSHD